MELDFQQLAEQLHGLASGEKQRKIQRKALKQVGEMFKTAIQERAPVRAKGQGGKRSLKPGELKASIVSRVSVASDTAVLKGRSSRVTIKPFSDETQHVANWVENGHANVRGGLSRKNADGTRSGPGKVHPTKPNTPAHPFVRPAFDATKDAAVEAYAASVTADIAEAMK